MIATAPARRRRAPKLPDNVSLERLCAAVTRDRRELEPFRRARVEMVRQYAGSNYGNDAAPAEVTVNLLGLYVEVITQNLVDNAPRVMLSTFDLGRKPQVDQEERWLNDELVRMGVVETYKRAIYDGLFTVGIVKVALATPADAAAEAWDVQAGQPFMDLIDLDDFACDTTARRFERCYYHACRYRIEVDLANELYAKGRADKFETQDRADYNQGGDERIHAISGTKGHREEATDYCDLWEVYIPRHKLVVTLRDDSGVPDTAFGPVRVQPWVGPAGGPYHFLSFGTVPGNLMPKAPIMDLFDLHRHFNRTYRKLMRRTADAKTVTVFDATQTDVVTRFKNEPDGGLIQGTNPQGIVKLESGGPTNDLVVMADHIWGYFNRKGGNIELLGGRGAQSRTASQDKMLNENAGAGISHLSDNFRAFVQSTCEAMLWYAHHHPTLVMETAYRSRVAPDVPFPPRRLAPAGRAGPPPAITIDPYSLARQTPQSRLAFIKDVLGTVAPMMQLVAQQGHLPDMGEILKLFAKYGDDPDIITIFGLGEPVQPGSGGDGGGMPANTTRTYNRVSSGGQGPAAEQQQLDTNVAQMQGPANPNSGGMQ
jgi:hypothetical protein